jgi:transposase
MTREERIRKPVASVAPAPAAFVAVALPTSLPPPIRPRHCDNVVTVGLQARLPNGVAIDLHGVELRHVGEVIEALGRLRCSASTKA